MRIIVYGNLHNKNKEGINLLKPKGVKVLYFDNLDNIKLYDDGNTILICNDAIEPINFSKIIYGPGIDFKDVVRYCKNNKDKNINIDMLSEWNKNLIKKICPESKANFMSLPFPVNVDKFKPDNKENKAFIYFNSVEIYRLQFAINLIKKLNINCKIFSYEKKYDEQDYLNYIKSSRFGIWVGRHESQGFAFQEALSCDCPLFVLDINSMKDECCNRHYYPWRNTEISYDKLKATAASYWSDECGLLCENLKYNNLDYNRLENDFKIFLSKINSYNPRKFILENLTTKQFINHLKNYFNI